MAVQTVSYVTGKETAVPHRILAKSCWLYNIQQVRMDELSNHGKIIINNSRIGCKQGKFNLPHGSDLLYTLYIIYTLKKER